VAGRGATLIVLGAIVFIVLASLSPGAAVAAFPGANGRIAYVLTEEEEIDHQTFAPRGDIVTVLPDGSGLQELTDSPLDESGPSWSADGRSLVFSRALGEGEDQPSNYQLFLMNGDGSGQTRITDSPGNDFSPSFSPDGRRIVYSKQPSGPEGSGRSSIWTIGVDGTDPRRLVSAPPPGYATSPQYSPNGRRIVFAGVPDGRSQNGIWTMRRDGSDLLRLTKPTEDGIHLEPDYSPDGRHIVFVRDEAQFQESGQPHLMRADGSRERPIPETFSSESPAYAPGGDRIALQTQTNRLNPFCANIFTISPEGSDRQAVTHNCAQGQSFPALAGSPSWQPLPGPVSNDFSFGKLRRNRKRGTAKLPVNVPGPGELDLAKTEKVKPQGKRAPAEAEVKFAIKPKGKSKRALRKKGKAKVLAKVTYTPDGGEPNTESKRLKLIDK
jgi:TolB protein